MVEYSLSLIESLLILTLAYWHQLGFRENGLETALCDHWKENPLDCFQQCILTYKNNG